MLNFFLHDDIIQFAFNNEAFGKEGAVMTDKELVVFGENIKKLRLERGLSQDELARLCGYTSRSSIAKIETGNADIPQKKIKLFANALNVSPGDITVTSIPDSDNPFLDSVDPQEQYLVAAYRSFNDDGRDRLVRYAHDLDDTGKYARDRKPDKTKEEAEAAYIKSRSESAQKPNASASNTIGEGKSETA